MASFSRLLVIWIPAIGSLYSWLLIYYFLITFIEKLIKKEYKDFISKPFLVTFVLYFFVLLALILNFSTPGLKKLASFSILIFLIPVFCVDRTSEKNAFLMSFAGRVSAILGTHTHVQTADEKIYKGTAFITDVGMCGDYNSIIGMSVASALPRLTGTQQRLQPAEGPGTLCATFAELDDMGRCISIVPVRIGPHLINTP